MALNANGLAEAENENDLSVVAVVRYGRFDAVIAGDLSGYTASYYTDVETSVAPKIGRVEVYKVNHHGSRYSTNDAWLGTLRPVVGIISAGVKAKDHHHPTQECLDRLHAHGVKTYWTGRGTGAQPVLAWDVIGNNIVVEVAPNDSTFAVTYNWTQTDRYALWTDPGAGAPPTSTVVTARYAWSVKSNVYHFSSCFYVRNISPANLRSGDTPPAGHGKRLHIGCPK